MNKYFGVALLAIVAGGVWWGCNQKERQTQNETKHHDLATLHDLAVKYSAIQEWQNTLTNKAILLTIDVQDALLNQSAPLEFTGMLADIRREGGHIVADFGVSIGAPSPFSLSLRLICSDDQRKLLTVPGASYAIIADIQKVAKQGNLNIISPGTRDDDGEIDEPTFEVNWDGDTYWVSGTCRDLRKLDE